MSTTTSCGHPNQGLLTFTGPTILVDIGFDPNYKVGSPGAPIAGRTGLQALIDTGAQECCIDSGLAMQMNLPIVDRRPISGAHGSHEVNIHMAQLHFPSFGITMLGNFAAVDLIAGGQAHFALIGRTFLQHVSMTYDGKSGKVEITF
jgi:predicted aspartyl protease